MLNRIVILAAGGTGSRLNANLPKQYMLLQDSPVLMHTIRAFQDHVDKIIVAIHPDMKPYWKELCEKYNFKVAHELVDGGNSRFQSVAHAIDFLQENYAEVFLQASSCIAVHDAARPLVSSELIEQSFTLAAAGHSNVLAQKSTNSIRQGSEQENKALNREEIWIIQTPQTFPAGILKKAYEQTESPLFTDDASVVEKIGYPIHLLPSTAKNIKLTYPEDFEIANLYLNEQKEH